MIDFALQIEPLLGFDYSEIRDLALLCEEAGFSSLWCSDHLFMDEGSEHRNCWEAWTTLAALAVETSTLRLGTLVTCASYRHPSMLAKTAACVDSMSGGRLEFGFGAGWKEEEYRAYGIPFPPPRERIDRFVEAMEVILRMWTETRATFEGRYYRVQDAVCVPKPAQLPHPPVWIGCEKPRMIGVAARYADGVNFTSTPTAEVYRQRLDHLRAACDESGRDFDRIRKSHFAWLVVGRNHEDVERIMRDAAGRTDQTIDELASSYHFKGTPPEMVEYLRGFTELGVDLFQILFPYGSEAASVRHMAEEVLPRLRESEGGSTA